MKKIGICIIIIFILTGGITFATVLKECINIDSSDQTQSSSPEAETELSIEEEPFAIHEAGEHKPEAMYKLGIGDKDIQDLDESVLKERVFWSLLSTRYSDYNAYNQELCDQLREMYQTQKDLFPKIQIASPEVGAKRIPTELIAEAQGYFLVNDIKGFYEAYGVECEKEITDFSSFEWTMDTADSFTSCQVAYSCDLDDDGEEELLFFVCGGSIRNGYLYQAKKNDQGKYIVYPEIEIPAGGEKIICYQDKYFLAAQRYSHDGVREEVILFSFNGQGVEEAVSIKNSPKDKLQGSRFILMKSRDLWGLVSGLDPAVEEAFSVSGYLSDKGYLYKAYGNEPKLPVNIWGQFLNGQEDVDFEQMRYVDINNDGKEEIIKRKICESFSVNNSNHLIVEIFEEDGSEWKQLDYQTFREALGPVSMNHELIQFFVESYEDNQYLVILEKYYGTRNYNYDVYLLQDGEVERMYRFLYTIFYNIDTTLLEPGRSYF